jgi:hypothetical protein
MMKMIKLIGENGFEKSRKDSTATSSRNLLKHWQRCDKLEADYVEK